MKREAKESKPRKSIAPAKKLLSRKPAEVSGGASLKGQQVTIGGDVVGRDKIVAGGDVVQGDKLTHVTVNRGAIQIGTFSIPTLPMILGALVVTAGLILVGLSLRETPGPAKMPGGFNVAVAQFGQEDTSGKVQSSEEGQRLSRTVFEVLRQQTNEFSDIELRSLVQIWHDSLPTSEMGADIGLIDDEQDAAELAERIGADMVIYGNIDRQNNFIPKFYVSTKAKGEIDSHVTGHHTLGSKPIRVDPQTQLATGTDLATRARALFYLTIGLTYDAIGRSQDALNVYREAETQLQSWDEMGEGKEVLHFFLGQAALYLSQRQQGLALAPQLRQEAQRAFENGINSNPNYARPHVGLGSVYFLQALDTQPLSALLHSSNALRTAFDEYNRAQALAKQSADQQAEILATYSLGTAFLLQAGAYRSDGQIDAADEAFRQAIDIFDAVIASLRETNQQRLLGQAYQAQGTAYKESAKMWAEQGDQHRAATLVALARQIFDQCIALGDDSQDEVLLELIIRDRCVPQRRALENP